MSASSSFFSPYLFLQEEKKGEEGLEDDDSLDGSRTGGAHTNNLVDKVQFQLLRRFY